MQLHLKSKKHIYLFILFIFENKINISKISLVRYRLKKGSQQKRKEHETTPEGVVCSVVWPKTFSKRRLSKIWKTTNSKRRTHPASWRCVRVCAGRASGARPSRSCARSAPVVWSANCAWCDLLMIACRKCDNAPADWSCSWGSSCCARESSEIPCPTPSDASCKLWCCQWCDFAIY